MGPHASSAAPGRDFAVNLLPQGVMAGVTSRDAQLLQDEWWQVVIYHQSL